MNSWWSEQSREPVSLEEIRRLASSREIEPDTLTWSDDGSHLFYACWHLDSWYTHPEPANAPLRSLYQIYCEFYGLNDAPKLAEDSWICHTGAEAWLEFKDFTWDVPAHLFPPIPELAGVEIRDANVLTHEYDVFISYRRANVEVARNVQRELEKRGLRVWRDERMHEESAGQDYITDINRAFSTAARVLVIWSREALDEGSAWIHAEAERARKVGKYLAISLEPELELVLPFNILETLYHADVESDFDLLLRALGAQPDAGRPGQVTLFSPRVRIDKLPDTYAKKLYGRDAEMRELIEAWDQGQIGVFAFDAMGGAGKTALIYHFVQTLKSSGWRGARAIFAWSFYSQGSNEDRQTDADEFFKVAIAFFSDGQVEAPTDSHEKGVVLSHLLREQRALLILDGLEPLQYAAGSQGGREGSSRVVGGIKDPGVKALLKNLADQNLGLCLVTTRIPIAELKGAAGAKFAALDRLPTVAGIELLRDIGVEAEFPPDRFKLPSRAQIQRFAATANLPADYKPKDEPGIAEFLHERLALEFIKAVEELRGHALALTLVGNHLKEVHEPLTAIHDLPVSQLEISEVYRSPYRVIRTVEIGLCRRIREQNKLASPLETASGKQLAILFFLGFFDRPADVNLLKVIFPKEAPTLSNDPPAPEGDEERRSLVRAIFAGMHAITPGELRVALTQLSHQGLITRSDPSTPWHRAEIDCHPLVREYFGARLKELDLPAYRAAHGRMYDYYRFRNLPEEFQDPVAYALLGDQVAYPEFGARRTVQQLLQEGLSEANAENTARSLVSATHDQLRSAAALIDTPAWNAALALFLPENEEGMVPLFAAIAHGCAAGREDEAWKEVYWPRVARGNKNFALRTLGLYGQELSALAAFFVQPFDRPIPELSVARQGLILNLAGYRLRAIGRLEDASVPMRLGSQLQADQGDLRNASSGFGNLSELLVTIGRVDGPEGAVTTAAHALEFADRSGDNFQRLARRTTHGNALFQAGRLADAEVQFREAERLQKEFQPDLPWLYSLGGFQHCDILLARGRAPEAAERADWALNITRNLQDVALNTLTQARAKFEHAELQAVNTSCLATPCDGSGDTAVLLAHYKRALAALRRANSEDHLPRGLLDYAEASWLLSQPAEAHDLLREAEAIATRGPMPLYAADAALLRARVALANGDVRAALIKRDEAAELISRHGYGRRKPDLAVLDAEMASAEASEAELTAALHAAIVAIEDQGWWGLIPRLEAFLSDRPAFAADFQRLHLAREAYNQERDAYLAAEAQREELSSPSSDGTAPVLPDELVNQIWSMPQTQAFAKQGMAQHNIPGEPGDLPMEIRRAIIQAILESNAGS